MNCLTVEEHFSAYLEDELDYQAIKEFEAHLTDCESCHQSFGLFRESLNLLHQLPHVEPSGSFDRAVEARVCDIDVEPIPLWHNILDALRAQPAWAFSGLAAILVAGLVGIYLYQDAPDAYTSSRPTIVVNSGQNVDVQRVDKGDNREELSLPVRRVNLPLLIEDGELYRTEVFDSRPPQRMQQNYILQTVDYTNAPRSGGL